MRGPWKYALGAYLLLVVVSVAASGSFFFLLLLAVLAAIFAGRRAGAQWSAIAQLSFASGPPALAPPPADPGRFEKAERELAPRFPEDPLDNPQLVEILSAYTHEPAEARRAIEDEYRWYRRRFLSWRAAVRTVPPLPDARRLETELGELRRYVGELEERASESGGLLERALDETGRADEAVERARAAHARLDASRDEEAFGERLDEAERKLRAAREALARDAERPVTALRLCAEATGLAEQVERQARTLVDLPAALEERRDRFEAERLRVEQELARVKDDFQASAQMYAPSCWLEVRGAGAAADRALERARARWRTASSELAAGRLDEARAQLDDAFGSLERALELTGTIDAHLSTLEAAALSGRERLAQAEKEIDRAWTEARELPARETSAAREPSLRRAAELVEQARLEIEKERPDWLTVTELAERSTELARATGESRPAAEDPEPDLTRLLDDAKARAKAARDSAWAWAIVSSDGDGSAPATPASAAAEAAFQAALRLEAEIPPAGPRGERTRAINDAIDAFRSAERVAVAASDEAEAEHGRQARPRAVGFAGRGDAGSADALVWGAPGLSALLADE